MVRRRLRIRFAKDGDLRLIGHRDLLRLFERLMRRAEVPLGMSEGFHPKPRMTFISALPLGTRGLNEVVEIELAEVPDSIEEQAQRLRDQAPPGLTIGQVELLPEGARKGRLKSVTLEIPVPPTQWAQVAEAARVLLEDGNHPAAAEIEQLDLRDGVLHLRLKAAVDGSAQPRKVLTALGLAELDPSAGFPTRTALELET